jgi:hypothetical protein
VDAVYRDPKKQPYEQHSFFGGQSLNLDYYPILAHTLWYVLKVEFD